MKTGAEDAHRDVLVPALHIASAPYDVHRDLGWGIFGIMGARKHLAPSERVIGAADEAVNDDSVLIVTRAIGFRAEPSKVHWAVVDGSRKQPKIPTGGVGTFEAPKTFDDGQKLSHYAKQISALLRGTLDPLPQRAWIRTAESVGQQKRTFIVERSRIEGVVLATARACGLDVRLGALATISASVKPTRDGEGKQPSAKAYLSKGEFRGIDWSDYDPNQREAILVAVAALS